MTEEKTIQESVDPNEIDSGSSDKKDPSTDGGGESKTTSDQSAVDLSKYIEKSQYEELESTLGKQGEELGEYRDFFKKVSPLLDKLDEQPELIEAILDGRLTQEVAEKVLSGEVPQKEAEEVTQAHEEVKKELGKKKYEQTSAEDIEKLIEQKVSERVKAVETTFAERLKESENLRDFENQTVEFMKNTPDFEEYAEDISKWFDEHTDQDNIEIAYKAVKGERLEREAKAKQQEAEGEAAKEVAANAAGGQSQTTAEIGDKELIDELIAPQSSPNVFKD